MARPIDRPRRDLVGASLTWLCGGTLALNLVLVVGLVVLLAMQGLGYFWQRPLELLALADGTRVLAEVLESETIPAGVTDSVAGGTRIRVKAANRDVTGSDFRWIDEVAIAGRSTPPDAVLLERVEWGNFHGFLRALRRGDETLAAGPAETDAALTRLLELKAKERAQLERLEGREIGSVNAALERLRLDERRLALAAPPAAELERRLEAIRAEGAALHERYEEVTTRRLALRERFDAETLVVTTPDGEERTMPVSHVLRAVHPNQLGLFGTARLYASRVLEFVTGEPRESNTEGGIFPAIFGTVMMVLLMSLFVTPFGVLAAVYLREYARPGPLVRLVRIAVNNLAGVPSIVFGVFGLGFFVYLVGGTIDQLFHPEVLPTPTYGTGGILWASLTLALLTVPVVIVATEEGLAAVPRIVREGSLALGATKFETLWRVVLPAAAPGILTGLILALARASGEVAPLMLVGVVKLAPNLPLDGQFPFLHLERKFMHLGFAIYDVGFQSPNVEAAKPLVFATALLLIGVVLATNLVAIVIRNHLREKYATSSI
jgi:phosphate transport system permease protein